MTKKIKQLSQRGSATLTFTTDSKQIGKADFIIITVPTPVTKSKEPNLSYVIGEEAVKRGFYYTSL